MKPLSEQEIVRREKLQKLRELGIDPYPAKTFEINTNSKKINLLLILGLEAIILSP